MFPNFQFSKFPSFQLANLPSFQVSNSQNSNTPFPGRLTDGKRPSKKNCMQWYDTRLQANGHCDSETESAHWANQ